MSSAVSDLLSILGLEQLEVNLFRGRSPQVGWQRVFGGQVIGQALVAAIRTVEGRAAHSMHAYFLLPGDSKIPIIYDVDRIRDGKSFTTRRVTARQHGHPIFSMLVSFHTDEPGLEHQAKMPDVPPPEQLPSDTDMREKLLPTMPDPVRRYYERDRPIELRPVEFERYLGKKIPGGHFNIWIRTTGKLPDLPAIHQCVLAYASDMMLLDTALAPHGRTLFEKEFMAASLDHALWLHRPFRADEWLLYAQDSPNLHGSRGLARGLIFTRDGTLVASLVQEGLVRRRRQPWRRGPMKRRIVSLADLLAAATVSFAASDREPPPPGSFAGAPAQYTNFTAEELERGFMALAFGSDLRIGARPRGIRRFDHPIRAVVMAGGSVDRSARMREVIAEYARSVPSLMLSPAAGGGDADIEVRLIDEKDFNGALFSAFGPKIAKDFIARTDPQC